jgi:hypothetical protein
MEVVVEGWTVVVSMMILLGREGTVEIWLMRDWRAVSSLTYVVLDGVCSGVVLCGAYGDEDYVAIINKVFWRLRRYAADLLQWLST